MRYIIVLHPKEEGVDKYWYNDGSHNHDCERFITQAATTIEDYDIASRIAVLKQKEHPEQRLSIHQVYQNCETILTNPFRATDSNTEIMEEPKQTETPELRMYSLVLYQLSGIQAGIQSGHSNDEYANCSEGDEYDRYIDWRENHKTVMVMNGGSSSMLIETVNTLRDQGIQVTGFREPDLFNEYTSFSFLLDEKYFKKIDTAEMLDNSSEVNHVRYIVSKLKFHGGK